MISRGFIVAVRPRARRGEKREPFGPAFAGAVYASRRGAEDVANRIRSNNPHLVVRVMREGAS